MRAASAETIIHQTFNQQKVPLALRLSGQLLLGVVRIYARKLELLHRDSDDALVKIRQARGACARRAWRHAPSPERVHPQAFRGAAVDLPPEALTAPLASITLPLDYDSLDFYADPSASYQLQLECVPSALRALAARRARTWSTLERKEKSCVEPGRSGLNWAMMASWMSS